MGLNQTTGEIGGIRYFQLLLVFMFIARNWLLVLLLAAIINMLGLSIDEKKQQQDPLEVFGSLETPVTRSVSQRNSFSYMVGNFLDSYTYINIYIYCNARVCIFKAEDSNFC